MFTHSPHCLLSPEQLTRPFPADRGRGRDLRAARWRQERSPMRGSLDNLFVSASAHLVLMVPGGFSSPSLPPL